MRTAEKSAGIPEMTAGSKVNRHLTRTLSAVMPSEVTGPEKNYNQKEDCLSSAPAARGYLAALLLSLACLLRMPKPWAS